MENTSEHPKFDITQELALLRRSFDSFKEESEQYIRALRAMRVSLEWWYYTDKYDRTPWVFFWLKLYYKHKAAQVLKKHRDKEKIFGNL